MLFLKKKDISSKLLKALNLDLDNIIDVSSSDTDLGRTIAGGSPKLMLRSGLLFIISHQGLFL